MGVNVGFRGCCDQKSWCVGSSPVLKNRKHARLRRRIRQGLLHLCRSHWMGPRQLRQLHRRRLRLPHQPLSEPAQPVIMASTKVAPAPCVVPATRVIAPPKKVEPVLPTGPEVVRPATGITKVPSGYKAAWSDDRLNPKRGIPTAAGIAASDLRWTRTVPRKLIQRSTGLDVTAQFTKLNYPFTDLKQQARFMAARDSYKLVVQPDGAVIMRPVADSVSNAKPKMRVSSKGASAPQASGNGRFIQVGAFGSPSNSNRTLSKIASLGLPAAQSKITRGGSNLTVVMAGPFHSAGSAQSALQQLKQSGFSDAYIR